MYTGITHTEFADELVGRTLLDTGRYGKVFYLTLSGDKRMPVLHLGMTGMLHMRGQDATYYRKKPKDDKDVWPPKFMKFILHFAPVDAEPDAPHIEIAFLDPRRLGRIRLCKDPLQEPPISALGFDPILCMPTLKDFQAKVEKRGCPIKALLLDQSFSAGVGNWIADEVLFHAAIHPEQVAKSLSQEQIKSLHHNITYVCQTAVDADADHNKFPSHWLFPHRWGKGKTKSTLKLPSGETASIKWITVGGRTSAVVQQVQKLSGNGDPKKKRKRVTKKEDDSDESSLTEMSEEDESDVPKKKAPAKRKKLTHSGLSQITASGLTLKGETKSPK